MRTLLGCGLTTALVALLAGGALAADRDLESMPGYIRLDRIEIPRGASEVTEIDLGPVLLQLAARKDERGDSKLTRMLSQIQSIQLKSFAIDEEQLDRLRPRVREIEEQMDRDGWQRLMYVKEYGGTTNISIKMDEGVIAGLMLIHLQPGDEAAFINVVGNLDLATLVNLATEGGLEEVVEEIGGAVGGQE